LNYVLSLFAMIACIAWLFFLLSDVFIVTIGKSPKTLDCMESIVFSNASNFAPYVPTVTPMSEEEGTGEEGEGIEGGGDTGAGAGAGAGAGVASESRPSKIVPPLVKCEIIITNRNSINE
jgi:hypothetical protein